MHQQIFKYSGLGIRAFILFINKLADFGAILAASLNERGEPDCLVFRSQIEIQLRQWRGGFEFFINSEPVAGHISQPEFASLASVDLLERFGRTAVGGDKQALARPGRGEIAQTQSYHCGDQHGFHLTPPSE